MPRPPIKTWFFALTVVRKGDHFLVVQEADRDQLWYLPAGRIEPGESLAEGALREVLEEAGIPVVLEGILRLQHTTHRDGSARLRIIFVARPADDTPLKSVPDRESLRAAWVTLEELDRLPLRGAEVCELFHAVASGATIAPLSLLGRE